MSASINHAAEEQVRVLNSVYEILSKTSIINFSVYKSLVRVLGAGMVSRLRLSPDDSICPRVLHLYQVVKCALGLEPFIEDQIVLSFEGLSTFYSFDCDLILEAKGKIYLIDFTSSSDYSILTEKQRVLNNKSLHPSLIGKNVKTVIRQFTPNANRFKANFERLVKNENSNLPQIRSLELSETVTRMNSNSKNAFIENCSKVLEYAIEKISKSDPATKGYEPNTTNSAKVKLAVKAAQSNDVYDTLSFLNTPFKKQYSPFIDSLRKITAQSDDIKKPFTIPMADFKNKEQSLSEVLYDLSSDDLAKVLHSAISAPNSVASITSNGTITFSEKFSLSKTNKKMLDPATDLIISAKHIKGHYFTIVFSYAAMDKFMRRLLVGENFKEIRPPKSATSSIESVLSKIKEEEIKLSEISGFLNKRVVTDSHSTIWDKVLSVSRLSKADLGNVGVVASNLISSTSFAMSRTAAGSLVSHFYEVVKTFSASIKNSHKDETYYVGVNGPYSSVTITKMSATQDSFSTSHYCVISKSSLRVDDSAAVAPGIKSKKGVSRTKFRTLNSNDVAYYLRLPYYILSLLTWDIENSVESGKVLMTRLPEKLTASTLHCLVNRDLFAQASQQVRYLYMSSIGYGSSAADIAKKIDFINPKSTWEFVYLARMIKMGLSLSIVRDNGVIKEILVEGDISVCFPHSSENIRNFSQIVSSMYYCNIFNKFRAFHEVSEAFCYNELDEEHEIYKISILKTPQFVAGFSEKTDSNRFNVDYLTSQEFVDEEIEFANILLSSGVGRFRFSYACVVAASRTHLKVTDEISSILYKPVSISPIEACTMRGAMDDKKPTDKSQGIRAASAILEEIIKYFDEDPTVINKNSWLSQTFINNVVKVGGDCSIYSLVVNQLCDDAIEYFFRIVQKDQVGNREISVLNAVFRIGALFVENISKSLSNLVKDTDLLENPDKDHTFEKAVQQTIESNESDIICYDNSDQKRWGPNHILNCFVAMFVGSFPQESGIIRIIIHVAQLVLHKKAKFPEGLLKLFLIMHQILLLQEKVLMKVMVLIL